MPKMVVTLVITRTNNNEQRTTNYSKQTQSNPILSAVALAKADSKWRKPPLSAGTLAQYKELLN
jgi:hypothetical protein